MAADAQDDDGYHGGWAGMCRRARRLLVAGCDTLPPTAIPSTVLIDKQGRVAGRFLGPVDRDPLRESLTRLADEPGPG